MATLGIKESLEVLAAGEAACEAIMKACADGRLGPLDLRYALEPAKAAVAAVKGRELVPAELKDVDAQEFEQLLTRAVALGGKVVEAVEALGKVLGA